MRLSQQPPRAGGVRAPFLHPGVPERGPWRPPLHPHDAGHGAGHGAEAARVSARPLCVREDIPPPPRHLLLGAEAGELQDPPGFGVGLCAVADLINRVWIKPSLCARPHVPIDSLAVSGLHPAREPKPLAVVGSLASLAVGAAGSAGSSTRISRAHVGRRALGRARGTHFNLVSSAGSVFWGPGGELPTGRVQQAVPPCPQPAEPP